MKAKGIVSLVISLIVISCLALVAAFGVTIKYPFSGNKVFYPSVFNSEYGLGRGVSNLGGSVVTLVPEQKAEREMLNYTVDILKGRLERQGYLDTKVQKTTAGGIKVFLPGVTDAMDIAGKLSSDHSLALAYENGEVFLPGTSEYLFGAQAFPHEEEGADGSQGTDGADQYYEISIYLTDAGKEKLAEASEIVSQAEEDKRYVFIQMNGETMSAPSLTEKIETNQFSITGDFTKEEAEKIASDIMYGMLPVNLKVEGAEYAPPVLAGASGLSVLIAGLIGLLLLVAFLVVFYRLAGAAAAFSLLAFASVLTMGLSGYLWPWGSKLTLSPVLLLGILLVMGISAGSCALVFVRAKEGLRRNRSAGEAFSAAFKTSGNILWEITFIQLAASAVLFFLGTGARDFAIVLMAGAVINLITTGLLLRFILWALVNSGFSAGAILCAKTEGSAK